MIPQPEASVILGAGEDRAAEAEDMGVRADSGTGGVLRPEPGQQQVPVKECGPGHWELGTIKDAGEIGPSKEGTHPLRARRPDQAWGLPGAVSPPRCLQAQPWPVVPPPPATQALLSDTQC